MDSHFNYSERNKSQCYGQKSKISIKQMCQKFESLSDSQDKRTKFTSDHESKLQSAPSQHTVNPGHLQSTYHGSFCNSDCKEEVTTEASVDSQMPKVPIRKNKSNVNTEKSVASVCDLNGTSNNRKFRYDDAGVNNRISVRERTKAFESSQHINESANVFKQNSNKLPTNNVCINANIKSQNLFIRSNTPPNKPSRVKFQNSCSKVGKTNTPFQNVSEEDSVPHITESEQINKHLSNSCEYDLVAETIKSPVKSVGLCSAQADTSSDIKCASLNPKSHGLPNKTSAFLNYIKSLGTTANHISEKVRTKSSNIFVDLISTTNNPPKHYGTLKHSHSEEHIYAEPFEYSTDACRKTSRLKDEADALHYMCSPVLYTSDEKSVVQGVDVIPVVQKESRFKNTAIRDIIYASFSLLRRPVLVEDAVPTEGGTADDDESDVCVEDVQDRIIYVKSVKKQISVSSICIAPKLFEALLIITISENEPEIVFKHPKILEKKYDYPLIPHFCFPDFQFLQESTVYKSETFSFTLIDGHDEKIFGYCHRILGWPDQTHGFCSKFPIAICLLSNISAGLFYKKILTEIEKHLPLPIKKHTEYLSALRKLGVPNAGASLSIPENTEEEQDRVVITRPLDSHTISMNLTRSLQLLDVDVLVKTVSSLLLERRVLLLSSNTQNILHCYDAVLSLLYPFQWQHLMIPIVPRCLMIQCCTESPYFLGLTCSDYSSILDLLSEHQVLIVDVDKGVILKDFGDEHTILPKKVQKALSGALNLAKNMTDPTEMMRDVMISEAALHMFVEMLGHIGNHIVSQGSSLMFQSDAFLKNAPSRSIQSFLEWFSETQMFEAFVEDCIWRRNYQKICQSEQLTLFEKRVEEYKWELSYNNDKISKKIGKTVKNIGEMIKTFTKN